MPLQIEAATLQKTTALEKNPRKNFGSHTTQMVSVINKNVIITSGHVYLQKKRKQREVSVERGEKMGCSPLKVRLEWNHLCSLSVTIVMMPGPKCIGTVRVLSCLGAI